MTDELNGTKMMLQLLQETRKELATLRDEVHAMRIEQAQRRGIERAAFWMAGVLGGAITLFGKWVLARFVGGGN